MELLHQVVARELADHVREVKDCTEPVELLTDKTSIFAQSEDSHGADGGLVGLLSAVADPHERKKPEVDLPAQFPVVCFCVFLCNIGDDAITHVDVQWDHGLQISRKLAFGVSAVIVAIRGVVVISHCV